MIKKVIGEVVWVSLLALVASATFAPQYPALANLGLSVAWMLTILVWFIQVMATVSVMVAEINAEIYLSVGGAKKKDMERLEALLAAGNNLFVGLSGRSSTKKAVSMAKTIALVFAMGAAGWFVTAVAWLMTAVVIAVWTEVMADRTKQLGEMVEALKVMQPHDMGQPA